MSKMKIGTPLGKQDVTYREFCVGDKVKSRHTAEHGVINAYGSIVTETGSTWAKWDPTNWVVCDEKISKNGVETQAQTAANGIEPQAQADANKIEPQAEPQSFEEQVVDACAEAEARIQEELRAELNLFSDAELFRELTGNRHCRLLDSYSDRQLLDELKGRGYSGTVTKTITVYQNVEL